MSGVDVGKPKLALVGSDQGWTAFQEAVSVQRGVLDRSPEVEYSASTLMAATFCSGIAASAAVTCPCGLRVARTRKTLAQRPHEAR